MPEYLSPGVYVEEVERGAKSIEGVSTSTAGFLGETERGPVQPEFITSFAEFKRLYGGFAQYRRNEPLEGTNLAYAVNGFFNNGGGRCWIGRVTDAEETADLGLGEYEPPDAPVADEDRLDFGLVVEGRTITETVEISHPGIENDPTIGLSEISAGGAFDVRLPDEGRTLTNPGGLDPNKPFLVEVDYHPTNAATHTGTLTVAHQGDDSPLEVDLAGQGVTANDPDAVDVRVFPESIDYGTVSLDTSLAETVTVIHEGLEGTTDVEITDVGLQDDTGEFTIPRADEVEGTVLGVGERVSFDVVVDHGTAETVDDTVEIDYTFDGNTSEETVTLVADVVDPEDTLGADVTEVSFGTVVVGTSEEAIVELRNLGDRDHNPLVITGVDASNVDGVEASLAAESIGVTLDPGQSTPLRIVYSPDPGDAPSNPVAVEYELPDGTARPDLTINVVGDSEERNGEYSADPGSGTTIEYGEVVDGESAVRSIVLSNTDPEGAADADITINDIAVDDEEFSLPDDLVPEELAPADPEDEAVLPPGRALDIPVTVTPDGVGVAEGELEVTYQDPDTGETTDTWPLRATGVESMMEIEAVGPGEWGGRIAVTVRNGARTNETFRVTVQYWTNLADAERIEAQGDPDVEETFSELTPKESSSNYYETVINSGSNLIEVERVGAERPDNGRTFLSLPPEADDDDGEDEGVGIDDYLGSEDEPRGERTGLAGFAEIDDIQIVSVPDENSIDGLTDAVISHCESHADRIAVLQAEQGADPGDLPPGTAISEYAAIYYPHIRIVDPATGVRKLVPPGGHVAGIYARTDREEGVYKAPANATVRGAVDLEVPVTKDDQARLNPKGVNAIRSFPGRGIRVWGARTTSADPEWKYVNVRRLFLYLEESIDEGTQWAVFESNTEELWARVRQSVRNFLLTVWREGGLAGTTPEEAFYVKADRTTMTQADIDAGKLIVEIGVAPVKPAEFVIFRIAQWTEGLEEGS